MKGINDHHDHDPPVADNLAHSTERPKRAGQGIPAADRRERQGYLVVLFARFDVGWALSVADDRRSATIALIVVHN